MNTVRKYRKLPGFTLIEVMVAAIILGLASFGLLALLRASDQMALKSRLQGSVASQFDSRVAMISALPYSVLTSAGGDSVSEELVYVSGVPSDDYANAPVFPAMFLFGNEDPSAEKFLIYGAPLPGEDDSRGIASFSESIVLTKSPALAAGGASPDVLVQYTLFWSDPISGDSNSVNFSQRIYDPKLY